MESLTTKITKEGSKDVYFTQFRRKGSLKKLIKYLRSDNVPHLHEFPGVKSVSVTNTGDTKTNGFAKIIRSPLPYSSLVNTYLGTTTIEVKYDVAYDDNILTSVCLNPKLLQGLFNFTEKIGRAHV